MQRPRYESYPRTRDRFTDHDPYYFRSRRTTPNLRSRALEDARGEEPPTVQLDEQVQSPKDDISHSQPGGQSESDYDGDDDYDYDDDEDDGDDDYDDYEKSKHKLPTNPPARADSDTDVGISSTSSPSQPKLQGNLRQNDKIGSSEESFDENQLQDLTIDGRKLLEAPAPAVPPIRPLTPQAHRRPAPVPPLSETRQFKPPRKTPSQESLLSCEREFLAAAAQTPPKRKHQKDTPKKPAPWGQGIPRHIPPSHPPDKGIKTKPNQEPQPYTFTLPICEAWVQSLTDGNIRFPEGSITHPPPSKESYLLRLFDLLIKISIPADNHYVFHCHDILESATIWLQEFQKLQNRYNPQLQSMNAQNPGTFTGSRPIFYGVEDPNPTKGERDFIAPHMRGVWTDERVEYNRAAFLTKIFEECPSTEGKLNMAVTICLMALYSKDQVAVITSLGELVKKTKESLFIPESWAGRSLCDSGYSRLVRITDDYFKFVYMRIRRLHQISPMYEYTSFENRHEILRPLSRAILKRDSKEDTITRKTPIHFKKMRSEQYLTLLKKCIIEGDINESRRELIRQTTKSTSTPPPPPPPRKKQEIPQLSCCMIFPRGRVDITKQLHGDHPHEDQLLWFLLTWYNPPSHPLLQKTLTTPQNALLTSPQITTAIQNFKLWLDPYDSDDSDTDPKPPRHKNPNFESIFRKTQIPPQEPPKSSSYKVYCQPFESHLTEGCFPIPTYGWEMYPHLSFFKARDSIPLPSPDLLALHRAISIAATESGAWGAGDEILAAEERKWQQCCKTLRPHYCLVNSMHFPDQKPWEGEGKEGDKKQKD
ncbi:hypothetical protein TWF481_010231 [Arthrobotrys musiformis]|uniref:Uncharacterized protein n=1 Tax=Arthrobotrys musiformis TaxID=47236 RepID=A0AAV9W052_9PEZI